MEREELIKIYNKAKQIALGVCGWEEKYLDDVRIDSDGSLSVHFSHYYRGDNDYEAIYLTDEDMAGEIQTAINRHRNHRVEVAKKAQEEKDKEEIKYKQLKEKEELATYKKLKEKYKDKL